MPPSIYSWTIKCDAKSITRFCVFVLQQRKHDKTHKNLKQLKTLHHCPITFPTFEASPAFAPNMSGGDLRNFETFRPGHPRPSSAVASSLDFNGFKQPECLRLRRSNRPTSCLKVTSHKIEKQPILQRSLPMFAHCCEWSPMWIEKQAIL